MQYLPFEDESHLVALDRFERLFTLGFYPTENALRSILLGQ